MSFRVHSSSSLPSRGCEYPSMSSFRVRVQSGSSNSNSEPSSSLPPSPNSNSATQTRLLPWCDVRVVCHETTTQNGNGTALQSDVARERLHGRTRARPVRHGFRASQPRPPEIHAVGVPYFRCCGASAASSRVPRRNTTTPNPNGVACVPWAEWPRRHSAKRSRLARHSYRTREDQDLSNTVPLSGGTVGAATFQCLASLVCWAVWLENNSCQMVAL